MLTTNRKSLSFFLAHALVALSLTATSTVAVADDEMFPEYPEFSGGDADQSKVHQTVVAATEIGAASGIGLAARRRAANAVLMKEILEGRNTRLADLSATLERTIETSKATLEAQRAQLDRIDQEIANRQLTLEPKVADDAARANAFELTRRTLQRSSVNYRVQELELNLDQARIGQARAEAAASTELGKAQEAYKPASDLIEGYDAEIKAIDESIAKERSMVHDGSPDALRNEVNNKVGEFEARRKTISDRIANIENQSRPLEAAIKTAQESLDRVHAESQAVIDRAGASLDAMRTRLAQMDQAVAELEGKLNVEVRGAARREALAQIESMRERMNTINEQGLPRLEAEGNKAVEEARAAFNTATEQLKVINGKTAQQLLAETRAGSLNVLTADETALLAKNLRSLRVFRVGGTLMGAALLFDAGSRLWLSQHENRDPGLLPAGDILMSPFRGGSRPGQQSGTAPVTTGGVGSVSSRTAPVASIDSSSTVAPESSNVPADTAPVGSVR